MWLMRCGTCAWSEQPDGKTVLDCWNFLAPEERVPPDHHCSAWEAKDERGDDD